MPQQRQQMDSVDRAWLNMEDPTNLMMITGFLGFAEPVDFDLVLQLIEARLLKFDRFRQRIVESHLPMGGTYWELDPYFDIRSHVRRAALPTPGDRTALFDTVSDLMSTPLDYSKPLWQFDVLDNYDGGSVIISRLHHSIADGIALVRLLLSLADDTPDAPIIPEQPETDGNSRSPVPMVLQPALSLTKSTLKLTGSMIHGGRRLVHEPGLAVDAMKLGTVYAARLGQIVARWPDTKTMFKGKLGVQKRAVWANPVSLDQVKAIGKALGGTVNDVMLSAVAGALRRYLEYRNQPTDELSFRAFIPVNLRDLDSPIELGNKFGLVFLPLPIGIVDQVERLRVLKRDMDELKASTEAEVAIGVLTAMGMMPVDMEGLVIKFMAAKCTAVMTNVPGPQKQLYLAGTPIKEIMGWVPQSGRVGLGVSIISYNGDVLLGINTDDGLIPDPEYIAEGFEKEFQEMVWLVGQTE